MSLVDRTSKTQATQAERKWESAFTLVELLIVIGVIGVLIAILLAAVNAARAQAQRVNCLANMNQIGHAYLMYAQDNRDVLPCFFRYVTPVGGVPFFGACASYGPVVGTMYDANGHALGPANVAAAAICDGQYLLFGRPRGLGAQGYLTSTDSFFCPADQQRRVNRDPSTGWGPPLVTPMGMTSPTMSYFEWYRPVLNFRTHDNGAPGDPAFANGKIKVPNASKKAIMADQGTIPNAISNPADDPDLAGTYPFFHKRGYNVLYVDGHAKWIDRKAVETFEGEPYKKNFQAAALAAFNANGG